MRWMCYGLAAAVLAGTLTGCGRSEGATEPVRAGDHLVDVASTDVPPDQWEVDNTYSSMNWSMEDDDFSSFGGRSNPGSTQGM